CTPERRAGMASVTSPDARWRGPVPKSRFTPQTPRIIGGAERSPGAREIRPPLPDRHVARERAEPERFSGGGIVRRWSPFPRGRGFQVQGSIGGGTWRP